MSLADVVLSVPAPKPRRKHRPNKPYHIDELIDLAVKGLSNSDIARHCGVSTSAISQRLKPYRGHIEANRDYAASRGFRLTTVERRALDRANELLDGDNVTLSAVVSALDVVHKAGRLERGQSTVNVNSITAIAERLERGTVDVDPARVPLDPLGHATECDAPDAEDVI